MKKPIAAMMTALVMFFCFVGVVGAKTTSGKMYDAVDKQLSEEHYDYDEGTLGLTHVKTLNLKKPVDDISTLKMAVAQYDTVRQNIFVITHTEVVYFNPDSGEVVPPAIAGKIDQAKAYKESYKDITGDQIHLAVILSLFALLLLVPAYLAYIWAKRQYTVLDYKLENNLFDGVGQNKYS